MSSADGRPRRSHRSRRDDYSDSEDDYPAPRTADPYQRPRSTRYENPRLSEPSLGRQREGDDRRDRRPHRRPRDESLSDDDAPSTRGSGRGHRRSFGEEAMESIGIGTKSDRGHRSKPHRRSRHSSEDDYSEDDRDRGGRRRGGGRPDGNQIGQAAQAAFTAAALEAWKSRNAPGGWTGEKGRRILTAAAGAGGIDKAVDRDGRDQGLGGLLTSAVGGLATSRLANGAQSRDRPSHRRARSTNGAGGGSGIKELAAGALAAGLGKKAYDEHEKGQARRRRDRDYTPSSDSEDDRRSRAGRGSRRAPPPQRSKSITDQFRDKIAEGLASFGLNDAARKVEPREERGTAVMQRSRSATGAGAVAPRRRRGSSSSSSNKGQETDPEKSDYDSDVARRKHKKLREKEVLNGALATVATVHSVHSLMEAKEARQRRHAKVVSGELTPAQAKVEARKATAKDLATIGIAAYGAKGAYSAWKEMTEKHKELTEFDKHAHECRRQRVEKNREEIARLNRQMAELAQGQQRLLASPGGTGGAAEYGAASPIYADANPYQGAVPPEVIYQESRHY